ncbi:MAG TPA: HD domain-containing protein [Kofleriaceae bacterium]|jgi:predicted HD phosphohydrolase|nr:HD domain-containing protein [Kofleriaceae bacterium]
MSKDEDHPRAAFSNMAASTQADWAIIGAEFVRFSQGLPDRVLKHLALLDGDYGGFPVDRLTHSLQAATLAHADGRDEEYVVCALLHDIGDTLGSFNHPDIAAAIVKPFVSEQNHWMVEKHGIFQGYYFFHHVGMNRDMREAFRDHPNFAYAEEFCAKYDGPAFDAKATARPLGFFEPMVRRVLARPKNSIYTAVTAR